MSKDRKVRQHLASVYPSGTVRARRWLCNSDIRGYRPPKGWTAMADVFDTHPITGRPLPDGQWWIVETKD